MPIAAIKKNKKKAPPVPSPVSSSSSKSASSLNYATISGTRKGFSRMVPNSSFGFHYQDEYSDESNGRKRRLNLILHNSLTDIESTKVRAAQLADWIRDNISNYKHFDDIRLMACHSARNDGALSLAEKVSNILEVDVTGHVGKLLSMEPGAIDKSIAKLGEGKMFSILENEKRSLIKKTNPFALGDSKAKDYDEYNPITFYGKKRPFP